MADVKTQTASPKERDGLALVVGGLFILALVFAAYNYFSKSNQNANTLENTNTDQQTNTTLSSDTTQPGNLDGNGATSDNTTSPATETNPAVTTPAPIPAVWTANVYNKGDIVGSSYTVKYGDTLWEIAVGVYGDGTQWTKILAANSSKVGFLPNGSQALIFSGQTLVLP